MKLTKRSIEALRPPAAGYDLHRDDGRPGFGLRITAAGARSFFFEGRVGGRNRRITLGRYPALSVDAAEGKYKVLAAEIAKGNDPVADKQRDKAQSITLREALAAYLADRDLKPRTRRDIDESMRALADWMPKAVRSITPAMVEKRHRALGERSPARANLVMRYLRAILNYAAHKWADDEGHPLIPYNPVKRLGATKSWYRVERRRTVLKEHEIAPWWAAVEALREDPALRHGPEFADYFELVLLTGLRRGEALGLTWDAVDFKARTLTVTDTKNREAHTLPLPAYLLDHLKARKERSAGEYVFSGPDGRRIDNFREALGRVSKASVPFCIHDLRRTFATVAERLDVPAYALKRLLNHKQSSDVTAGYVVVAVERLREPMEKIADFVLRAAGLHGPANVTPIRQAR